MPDYAYSAQSDVVNSSYWSAALHNILLHNIAYFYNRIATNGWLMAGDTFVYVSATSFKVTGVDLTAKYRKGTKIMLTDAATTKYFYVSASSFSTDTTVTITAGSDFSLSGGAITNPFYSYGACPSGHPIWFNWTPTWGGFSSPPTGVYARFAMMGTVVIINVNAGSPGTSNATTFTVTVPVPTNSGVAAGCQYGTALFWTYDNGAYVAAGCALINGAGDTSIDLFKSANTAWTASGTKAAAFQLAYEA
jgi:hypothetical protein